MEQPEVEKSCPGTDDVVFARNRSFKSKQLVRSQAIRESTSPPRAISPAAPASDSDACGVTATSDRTENVSDTSSHSDKCSVINSDRKYDDRKKQVEIQITSGAWEDHSEQRLRTRRWLGHRHHSDSSRDLLSYSPRVTCVCGTCACPHCRGRKAKQSCPTKQDSGIVCSEDCPDCTGCAESEDQNGDEPKGSCDAEDQGSLCRCSERREKPNSFSLTRTDSEDKIEPTGPELVQFIRETLNKNPRDRTTLLRIEKELHSLINDNGRCIVRFPVMTSYGRMLVHRCAALFHLAHHLDHANKNSVLVSKSGTSGGRVPCTSFRQWCTTVFPKSPPRRNDDTLAKSILKREGGGSVGGGPGAAPRSKSLEQRERDYERVRRRIFSSDNCTQDETQWPWLNAGPVKLLTPEAGRNKLLKVQSLEARGPSAAAARGSVSKSHSFGGYTAEPPTHRQLSRQGDLASSSWRLSPSSSGYKTLSLRSTDSVTPSPTGGASPEPHADGVALVWAVTDLSAVPVGAVVIHPQTGRALINPDGSLYHFDPDNPPVLYDAPDDIKADSGEKRRGKLEKQHSFIENECTCADEYRNKCCCENRRSQPCPPGQPCPPCQACQTCHGSVEKTTKEIQTNSIPCSPIKNRYKKPPTPETKSDTNQRQEPNCDPNRSYDASVKYESPKRTDLNNQKLFESQDSNSPKSFAPTNQRVGYEATNHRSYEAANQRSYEATNQRSSEATNQGASFENQRPFDSTRQYDRSKVQNQECMELQPFYAPGIRNEEITSPLVQSYPLPEEAPLQTKTTPVPADPSIRPLSLSGVSYPVAQPPAYPYVNHCRIQEQHMAAPVYQLQPEVQKVAHDNTFRIDPSYPYAADFAACGACDPAQQRPYNVQYGVEMGQMGQMGQMPLPPYPIPLQMPNVLLQSPLQYTQYQEPIQWQSLPPPVPISPAAPKLMLHDVYPVVYPGVYQPYNVVYPQVIPQPYPVCQPVYPVVEKPPERRASFKRTSLPNSSRTTPQADDRRYEDRRRDEKGSNEIAMKIQQIKEQMAQVSVRDRDKGTRRDDWRRRNSGSGLLGSYPVSAGRGRPGGRGPDEAQLSSAARAIVNSIRNMQAKNYQDRRPDGRRRTEYRPPAPHAPPERRDVRRNMEPILHYRPPYLFRQMSPNTWCRRSPGPVLPVLHQPRRPHPDPRSDRR